MSEVLKFCLGFEICDKDFQISKRLRDVKTLLEILAGPVNLRKRIRILYFFLFLLLTGEGRKGIKEKKKFLSFLWGSQCKHLQGNWKAHFKQFATAMLCLPPFPSSQDSGNASTQNALVKLSEGRRESCGEKQTVDEAVWSLTGKQHCLCRAERGFGVPARAWCGKQLSSPWAERK